MVDDLCDGDLISSIVDAPVVLLLYPWDSQIDYEVQRTPMSVEDFAGNLRLL